jgi:hypothetical protein
MRNFFFASLLVVSCARAAITPDAPVAGKVDAGGVEFFEKHIRPVLSQKCYGCHSTESGKTKGGLLLDTREGIRAGGDSGHAVVPGSVKDSLLIKALRYTDKEIAMPPKKEGGKLPDDVVAKFEQWVQMGAPDPRENTAGKIVVRKTWDLEEGRKFWAYQPPKAVAVPTVKDAAWPRGDVDRFLLAAMELKGLHPVADADKATLIRRVYFDIIGLPPRPEEVDAFVKDNSPNAYAKIVDRLLASPQFGERWGRHWLDVARYGESSGKERNYTFPTAWRYRDWVIAAMNADKPYDQFIREQVAGDLMPHTTPEQRDQLVIATGFLAIGTKSLNEKNRELFRMEMVDEQIDTTTRAVLATTVACARCHDHKFDPIAQKDYYAMAGIFKSSQTYFGIEGNAKNKHGSSLIPLSTVEKMPAPSPGAAATSPPPAAPKLDFKQKLARLERRNPKAAERIKALPPAKQEQVMERIMARIAENAPPVKNAYAAPANTSTKPECMGVLDARPGDARLLVRGEIDQPADMIPRGFVPVLTNGTPPKIPGTASGRLELANWLTDPTNPLTARVMVNRVWQHLFGEGLVGTADNFGTTGEKPSNPALLDTLAVQFMREGWSVKSFIRSIVQTRAYQLSSASDSKAMSMDPDNHLLWRQAPRRLDAEAIRDAMLAASGQLDATPAQGSFVAIVGEAYVGRGVKPEAFTNYESNKRSVYLPIVRDNVPEVLDLFDFAEPSLVIASRDVTNVPSQALYLMNNRFVRERADALAQRVLATPLDFPGRINLAHQLTLGRAATTSEFQRAHAYLLSEARALIPARDTSKEAAAQQSWATFCQALFASAEFRYIR